MTNNDTPLNDFSPHTKNRKEKDHLPAPERILVVDDDAEIRELLSIALTRIGFEVITVDTGAAAIETANRKHFAAAFVDLNMPGLPGMETVQMLKQFDPDMEVIVFTGYPTFESSVKAIHSQVFDYICKPVDARTLQRAA
ncbi:MAG TPA: response regulator [Deltaproteobacteria bacterium]|nr:response regulator [Deltaproteobacteria bacterium]